MWRWESILVWFASCQALSPLVLVSIVQYEAEGRTGRFWRKNSEGGRDQYRRVANTGG